jgi:putative transposase
MYLTQPRYLHQSHTIRPHSSLGYKPPALEAWLTSTNKGYGKVESKKRLPLFHTPDYGGEINQSPTALH